MKIIENISMQNLSEVSRMDFLFYDTFILWLYLFFYLRNANIKNIELWLKIGGGGTLNIKLTP